MDTQKKPPTTLGLIPILLLLPALAGCVSTAGTDPLPGSGSAEVPLYAPPLEDALWDDPQHFPHPAYGWATITHVPADAPHWWQPIPERPHPTDIKGLQYLTSAGESIAADGMVAFGRLLVIAGGPPPGPGADLLMPAEIFDLSDPDDPVLLSSFEPEIPRRQVDLIAYPDGRLVAVFASDAGVIPVYEITDPTTPEELAVIDLPSGGHTVAVVPGTPIVYNANTVGSLVFPFHELNGARSSPQTEIYDLSDPEEPVLVQVWENGLGCHAISFHITAEKQRAYCAGVDYNQIWDISDPAAPKILATFPMGHGIQPLPGIPAPVNSGHTAFVNRDTSVLVIGDETFFGILPACDVYFHEAGHTVSGPLGNLWFYDIRDEKRPVLQSWLSPNNALIENPPPHNHTPTGSCAAHEGTMVPDPSRDLLSLGHYAAGTLLVDFTDPKVPFIVDQWNPDGQILDVWYNNGFLFAGDIDGGFHVFTLE
ncbi:MAG: hypothetical protein KY455_13830 [Euryarchaeota archaeon]|nr:hypothetical protein [Euryarchaeota archaeon]